LGIKWILEMCLCVAFHCCKMPYQSNTGDHFGNGITFPFIYKNILKS
jgi:hypothetical protein